MTKPDPVKSHAVLVGVGSYVDDHYPPVHAAANNLKALREVLTSAGGVIAPANCTVVLDPTTPADILKPLLGLPHDVHLFIFYYVGHGICTNTGELRLTVRKTYAHAALVNSSSLAWDHVRTTVHDEVPAQCKIVIIDSCYSGIATDHLGIDDAGFNIEGAYVLASSPANRKIKAGYPHTFFTGALLEVLRNGVTDSARFLTPKLIYKGLSFKLLGKGWHLPPPLHKGTVENLALMPNNSYKGTDELRFGDHVARLARWGSVQWRKHQQRRALRASQTESHSTSQESVASNARSTETSSRLDGAKATSREKAHRSDFAPTDDDRSASSNARKGGIGGFVVICIIVFFIAVANSVDIYKVTDLDHRGDIPISETEPEALRYDLRAEKTAVESTFVLPTERKYRTIGADRVAVSLAGGCHSIEFTLTVRVDGREHYKAGFQNKATDAAEMSTPALPTLTAINFDVAGTTRRMMITAQAAVEPGCVLTIRFYNFRVIDGNDEWLTNFV